MMATEIIKIDASWAEKWTKTGVPFLSAPTVHIKLSDCVGSKFEKSDIQMRHTHLTLSETFSENKLMLSISAFHISKCNFPLLPFYMYSIHQPE